MSTPDSKTFPTVVTRSEIKRIVWQCCTKWQGCRPGQAVANNFTLPQHIENSIWEMKDKEQVVQYLYNWQFGGTL